MKPLLPFLAFAVASLPAPVWAPPDKGEQALVVLRVVDGDTVEAAYIVPVTLRIHGINAPELSTPEGKAARDFAKTLLAPNSIARAKLAGREKYGRMLADLQVAEDKWFAAAMIEAGHAKAYDGHGPRP